MPFFSNTISLFDAANIDRIPVLQVKEFMKGGKSINVTPEFLNQMAKNLNDGVAGKKRPITIAHPDLSSAEAQGWVVGGRAKVEENQLFVDIEWGNEARQKIEDKKFGYVSPVFTTNYTDQTGKEQGPALLALGITNNPHWTDQKPLFDQFTAMLNCNQREEAEMPEKTSTLQVQFDALQSENEGLKKSLAEAQGEIQEFSALKQKCASLQEQLELNSVAVKKMRGDALISKFQASGQLAEKHLEIEGKATALKEMAYHEPEKFEAIVSLFDATYLPSSPTGSSDVGGAEDIPEEFTSTEDFNAFNAAQKWVEENPGQEHKFGDKYIEFKQKNLKGG